MAWNWFGLILPYRRLSFVTADEDPPGHGDIFVLQAAITETQLPLLSPSQIQLT